MKTHELGKERDKSLTLYVGELCSPQQHKDKSRS
jgi:hypothetical protein